MRRFEAMADLEAWKPGWGLGLMLMREGDWIFVGHGGAMPGFLTGLAISPKERVRGRRARELGRGGQIERACERSQSRPPTLIPWSRSHGGPPPTFPLPSSRCSAAGGPRGRGS